MKLTPKNRKSTSPGEILQKDFLDVLNISREDFSKRVDISLQVLNKMIDEEGCVNLEIAYKLSRSLGTSVEFWLNLKETFQERMNK